MLHKSVSTPISALDIACKKCDDAPFRRRQGLAAGLCRKPPMRKPAEKVEELKSRTIIKSVPDSLLPQR
jgi:hypothetical protein